MKLDEIRTHYPVGTVVLNMYLDPAKVIGYATDMFSGEGQMTLIIAYDEMELDEHELHLNDVHSVVATPAELKAGA